MPAKGAGKRRDNHLYPHALPIVPHPSASLSSRVLTNVLGASFTRVSISNPQCIGTFDVRTRSVWVTNTRDIEILWRRGFFGKGNLSRSEPTWLNRRVNQLAGAKGEHPVTAIFLNMRAVGAFLIVHDLVQC